MKGDLTMNHKKLLTILNALDLDIGYDDYNQIVVYTGIFEWEDCSLHDVPEPELQQEPEPRDWLKDQGC